MLKPSTLRLHDGAVRLVEPNRALPLADADPHLQILRRRTTSAIHAEIEDYPTGSSASTVELKVWLPEGHLRQDRRRAGPQW